MNKAVTSALIVLTTCISLQAQSLDFSVYPVNETSYSALFPDDPGTFEVEISEDSLSVYIGSAVVEDVEYGLIMVDLEDHFVDASCFYQYSFFTCLLRR